MKRIFLTLTLLTLICPFLARTASAEMGIDFFYNNLSGGSWIEVGDYGYCWQPDVAVNDSNWRPYADGYWAYTDDGWTWVSYEDFGWATYHYGRWAKLTDYGWVWVPGSDLEWGPAWVSWRTGGNYIGWAPLPPRGAGIVYEGQPIGGSVDVDFDIGPEYYNFCDVRYIGEPVLRERIVDVRQNVTYINQTVNVTNITVRNNTVYNYGPDINVVNQHSSRPIQRLHLERQENVDAASAAKSGGITKVQGNNLVVAAPMKITRGAQGIAPPQVKTKVSQPKIDKGWAGISANEQAQLKQKIKTEDRNKIPAPTGAAAAATGQAAVGRVNPASPSPAVGTRGERRAGEQAQPGASAASAAPAAVPAAAAERGKQKGKRATPPVAGLTANEERTATSPTPERGRQIGRREGATPPVTAPTPEGKRQREERENVKPTPGGVGQGGTSNEGREGRRRVEPGGTPTVEGRGTQNQGVETRGEARREESAPPRVVRTPARAPAGEAKQEPKKKPEKGSPSPSPQ